MSDCRFGVSPVNYPDPDRKLSIYHKLLDNLFYYFKELTTVLWSDRCAYGHFSRSNDEAVFKTSHSG